MSYLGGIIAGAIGGVGDAGQQITQQNAALMDKQDVMNQQLGNEQTLATQRSDLETQKAKALADYQETIKNAPMTRAAQYIKESSNTTVPIQPEKVNSLTQDSATNSGLVSGLQGDSAQINAFSAGASKILNDPKSSAEDKANAQGILDQISKQIDSQQHLNTNAVQGQTRPLTKEEIFSAALEKANVNGDLAAAAALKASIPDSLMILPDGSTLYDKTTNKIVMSNTGKQDRQEKHDLNMANMKADHDERMAALNKSDPEFIKVAKLAYGEGTPEYNKAIKDRVTKESGAVDTTTIESNAQAIAAGKQDPPNLNSRSPQNAAIMARVYEINPEYNKRLQVAAQKSANSFAAGPDGVTVNAFNATADHLVMLKEAADALKNGKIQVFNQLGNAYAKATGAPAPTNMATVSQLVAGEIVKAVTAGNGALGDREGLEKNLQSKLSPDQIAGTIDTFNGMIKAQIDAKYQKYNSNIPAYVNNPEQSDFARFLSPRVREMTGIKPPAGKDANWGTISAPTDFSPKSSAPMVFSSKDELKSAISAGKIKPGDTFTDPNGASHVVQ